MIATVWQPACRVSLHPNYCKERNIFYEKLEKFKQARLDIPEDDVPLAAVPDTGDNSGIWLVTAAMSAMGLVVLILIGKRKEED